MPSYIETKSLAELNGSGTDKIIGIERRSASHLRISETVIPAYDLNVQLVESSTPAMLAQSEDAYRYEEPIAFLAWSPHWMNEAYDFRYLEDPEDAQGKFNDPARISFIVREDLSEVDPTAYAFLKALPLSEKELIQIEAGINRRGPGEPREGVELWLSYGSRKTRVWSSPGWTPPEKPNSVTGYASLTSVRPVGARRCSYSSS